MPLKALVWHLATGLGLSRCRKSYPMHQRRTIVRAPSWSGSGCAETLQMISSIRHFQKVIRSGRMSYTDSIAVLTSQLVPALVPAAKRLERGIAFAGLGCLRGLHTTPPGQLGQAVFGNEPAKLNHKLLQPLP